MRICNAPDAPSFTSPLAGEVDAPQARLRASSTRYGAAGGGYGEAMYTRLLNPPPQGGRGRTAAASRTVHS